MLKQEGKSIDGEKGEGSIDLDTYNPHSPSYMLGQASPTSMEWANAKLCQTAAAGGAGSDDDRICRLTLLLHHARQQMQQRPNATTSLFPVLPPPLPLVDFSEHYRNVFIADKKQTALQWSLKPAKCMKIMTMMTDLRHTLCQLSQPKRREFFTGKSLFDHQKLMQREKKREKRSVN